MSNGWIQIRSDILLGLIWVQTVCKDYQQTTNFATGRQRNKPRSTKNLEKKNVNTVTCMLFIYFVYLVSVDPDIGEIDGK